MFSTATELMASRPGSSLSPRGGLTPRAGSTLGDSIRQKMADKIRNAKVCLSFSFIRHKYSLVKKYGLKVNFIYKLNRQNIFR